MHSNYIHLKELWHEAARWLNWSEYDEGVGIADYLIEGAGDFTLEFEGDIYTKPKKELRRALKKNWIYQANSVRLVLTPFKSWKYVGNKAELEAKRKESLLRYAIGL